MSEILLERALNPEQSVEDAMRIEALKTIEAMGGEDRFLQEFGLGAEELTTVVRYGEFHGTLLDALDVNYDPVRDSHRKPCPVGGNLKAAFAEDGIAGVEEQLGAFKVQARSRTDEVSGERIKNFDVKISEKTRQRVAEVLAETPKKK